MGPNSKTNVFPLIQTFPVDLLVEIFLLSVSARLPPAIHVSAEPPTSLCRVCRSWQEVALGLPRLWTAICVDMNALPEGSEENKWLWESVHQWVVRASPFPLTFKFKFKHPSRESPKLTTAFNAFVVPFAHRLRHLDIEAWISQRLWSDLQFPALETVILRGIVDVHDESTVLFPSAPCLRWVCVFIPVVPDHGHSNSGRLAKLFLPWNQLTHLYTGHTELDIPEWQGMLQNCLNLQRGVFFLSDRTPVQPLAFKQRVTLHHLVELTVIIFERSIFVTILSPFEFPVLRTLRVEGEEENDGPPWAVGVHRIFFQKLLPLQMLCLGSTRAYEPGDLDTLLKSYRHFRRDRRYQRIFSCLQHDQENHCPLAPNLEELTVASTPCRSSRVETVIVKIISDVVQSRTEPSCQEGDMLEMFVPLFWEGPEAQETAIHLAAELQPWVNDGFHLKLYDSTSVIDLSNRLDLTISRWNSEEFGE